MNRRQLGVPGSATFRLAQVLIAGGGPVGLSAAVELGLRGISCVIVEPRAQPTRTPPRAKTLNIRKMEHLRRWGVADRLRSVAPVPTWWSQDNAFCTSLLGTEITRFTGVLGLSDEGVSPELGQQAPQYVLEEMLREIVLDLATCTFLVGCRVTGLDLRDDSVEVQVQHPDGRIESAEYFSLDLVLGHQYCDSPVIPADRVGGPPDDDQWATTARPGRRILHAWMRPGVSSLDLTGPGLSIIAPETADTDSLARSAAERRVAVTVHHEHTADLACQLGANVIVRRPDHVVAWCGEAVSCGRKRPARAGHRRAAPRVRPDHSCPQQIDSRPAKRRPE